MTAPIEVGNAFLLLKNDLEASASTTGSHNEMTLEEKLLLLDQTPYLRYFQELQNNYPVTQKLRSAYELLIHDAFSVNNCECAMSVTAKLLWPESSWTCLGSLLIYLQTPNGRPERSISQRALIRINQANEPVSTVTLMGQHGRKEFDLRDPSQLYKLFEAVVDSEFTFVRKEQQLLMEDLHHIVEPPPSMPLLTPFLCTVLEHYGLHTRSHQGPPRSRVRNIKDGTWVQRKRLYRIKSRTSNPSRLPFQPSKPSDMRYELLPHTAIPFHLITWPRLESVALPNDLAQSVVLQDFITVDGEPGCDYDESILFYLMGLAIKCLVKESMSLLAMELCELRILLRRSRRGVHAPFGPTSGRLVLEPVGLDDKIHIICREDVSDKIGIWKIDKGQRRTSCIVRIEKHSENGLRMRSSLEKRDMSTQPRDYRSIAPKKPRLE